MQNLIMTLPSCDKILNKYLFINLAVWKVISLTCIYEGW